MKMSEIKSKTIFPTEKLEPAPDIADVRYGLPGVKQNRKTDYVIKYNQIIK